MSAALVAARLDMRDLCRRWRCSRPTVYRRLADGTLPPPLRLGRNLWDVAAVEAAEQAMHAAHAGGAGLRGAVGLATARRAAARQREGAALTALETAAAAFLSRRGVADLAEVIGRFTPDGRISSIPPQSRSAALRALGVRS